MLKLYSINIVTIKQILKNLKSIKHGIVSEWNVSKNIYQQDFVFHCQKGGLNRFNLHAHLIIFNNIESD